MVPSELLATWTSAGLSVCLLYIIRVFKYILLRSFQQHLQIYYYSPVQDMIHTSLMIRITLIAHSGQYNHWKTLSGQTDRLPINIFTFIFRVSLLGWFPCPNVGQASTNHDLRLDPGACFSCIVTNLHLSVI